MAFDERARDIRPCRRFCQRHHRRRRRRHLPRDGSSLIVAFACEPTPGVTRMRDRVRLLVIFGETAYGITRQRDNACNGLPRSENRRTRVSYEFQDRVALHCVRRGLNGRILSLVGIPSFSSLFHKEHARDCNFIKSSRVFVDDALADEIRVSSLGD